MQSDESKILIQKLLEDFDPSKQEANIEYLESQLSMLNNMAVMYKSRSKDPDNSIRERAIARDLEQNCLGLINGIMFALSFIEHKDINLADTTTE